MRNFYYLDQNQSWVSIPVGTRVGRGWTVIEVRGDQYCYIDTTYDAELVDGRFNYKGQFAPINNNGQQTQQQTVNNFTTQSVIDEIQNALYSVLVRQILDPLHVRKELLKMEYEGKVTLLGAGTNRICVKLKTNDEQLKQQLGFGGRQVVYMVPAWKLVAGKLDNEREVAAWNHLNKNSYDIHDQDNNLLRQIGILPSVQIPNTAIVMQEEVIRIEDSSFVKELIRDNKFTEAQIGDACCDVLLNHIVVHPQYVKLMKAIDKKFVVADLNPHTSPFNFGFKRINNELQLCVLDFGYNVPRTKPLNCPTCGREMHYLIGGELKENGNPIHSQHLAVLESELARAGLYCCNNHNCTQTGPTFRYDMDVFLQYLNQ